MTLVKMSLEYDDDWEPAPGEHPTWSMEEIESHPLFMTGAPTDEGNPHIEALQSVLYDDTPEAVAQNFKTQGNDALKRGLVDDAIIFYKKAVETNCKDANLMSSVHSNLALVYLRQARYPECVDECYRAIGRDPNNVKAFFRGASASLKLELYSQGLYFAKGGLAVEADNEELKSVCAQLEEARQRQADAKKTTVPVASKLKFRWRD